MDPRETETFVSTILNTLLSYQIVVVREEKVNYNGPNKVIQKITIEKKA
jgi:hypothetical protein